MAKSKPKRSLKQVGMAQHETEKIAHDKFSETQDMISSNPKKLSETGKLGPRLTCSVGFEEKEMLEALALYATNKNRKIVNTSAVIRSLIRYGFSNKEELDL